MNCKNHNGTSGVNTCSVCGDWICDECTVELDGRLFCKNCVSVKEKSKDSSSSVIMSKSKAPSSFLTLCCAFIPGCGQMYLGLTKRGLVILSIFLACNYLDMFSSAFFFVGILTWFFGFFDTFNNKKKIDSGIEPSDDIDDLKKFITDNKLIVIGSLGVIFVMEFLSGLSFNFFGFDLRNGMILLIIILGIYCISKKNKQ